MPKTIAQLWDSYEQEVIPAGAGETQVQECRRAFYAGASAALRSVLEIGEDTVSEDQGVDVLEQLTDECLAFMRAVAEGRA